jgi:hypothetical protein
MHVYADARVREIPESERMEAKLSMTLLWATFDSDEKTQASAGRINFPDEMRHSAMVYVIQAHEWEHRLEMQAVKPYENPHRALAKALNTFLNPVALFRAEKRAMYAEWEILSILPDDVAEESIEDIKKSSLDDDYKEIMIRRLQNRHLERDKYIEAEHKAFRYNGWNVMKGVSRRWAVLGAVIGVPCYLVYAGIQALF